MPRYFIEVAYRGSAYSGFQVQHNANTVQAEIEKAFQTLERRAVHLTGSSRTDAGVHAQQNFFHFDDEAGLHAQFEYKMNAILPADIVLKKLIRVREDAHSRFDAVTREYEYRIYRFKDPFLRGLASYYPMKLDEGLLRQAAALVMGEHNFRAFSKTNTQVQNFRCHIIRSDWSIAADKLIYNIEGNRFLRGMVRMLTAGMVAVARGKMNMESFSELMKGEGRCGRSAPAEGLYLMRVNYPENYFR